MPRLINKLKAKLSRTESGRNSQVHPSAQPNSPTEPNEVPAVLKPSTGIEPTVEHKPLQGRLWNEAYELLKSSHAELVASYERVLSRELLRGQHGDTEPASSGNRINAEYGERWRQMYTVADAALRRQEEKVAKKQNIGAGLAASEMISNIVQEAKANHKALWRDAIKVDDWTGQLDDIRHAEATVQEGVRAFNGLEIQRRLAEIDRGSQMIQSDIQGVWPKLQERILSQDEERCLKDLRVTDPRDDKSRIELTNGGLLQGAYSWAIKHDDFVAWRDGKEKHLLWIKGDPGKGKTMLVCGIIDELQICDIRPCYFFCQATDPRLNSATAVLRGLIYLLVVTNRQLLPHIQEKYDQAGTALFQDVNSWVVLSQMFTQLLEEPGLQGQILIIDALDECQTDLERLLDLIVVRSANVHVKWIVSSRNEPGIEGKLRTLSPKIRFSLELNEQAVSEAVRVYISHKADQLKEVKDLDEETDQKVRTYLTDNARGTFLWVALVCKELLKMGVHRRHLFKKMSEFPSDLASVYARMMRQIRESEDSGLCERTLEVVAIAYRPVTLVELASLLDIQDEFSGDDLEELVGSCGSFLVVRDEVVRFVHQSAQDFLLNDEKFASGLGSQHYKLFSRSMEILSATLRRDMYNLRYPGALLEEHTRGQEPDVYSSAIIFTPESSLVRQLYEKTEGSKWITATPDMPSGWTARLQYLDGHPGSVIALAFSPDKMQIASGLSDGTARVWGTETGACLHIFRCHGFIESVAFAPDSKRLAIGLLTGIEVWDLMSETKSHALIHGWPVGVIAFAPDRAQLSALCKGLIRTWDLDTGVELKAHELGGKKCHDIAYSPDGTHLACVSDAKGVQQIWNLTANKHLAITNTNFDEELLIWSARFSSDASRLAVPTLSCIYIFDASTSELVQTLETNLDASMSFGFLADSKRLISAIAISSNGDLVAASFHYTQEAAMWDLTSAKILQRFRLMTANSYDSLVAAAFSLDDSRLGFVSKKGTVYICDTHTGGVQAFQDFFEPLDCYQPSPLQLRKELQLLEGESEDNDQPQEQVQPRMFDTSGLKTSCDGTWILKGQQRVLWLPPDYRPSRVVSHDGYVVIRFGDSQALFLRFAVDELNALLA
ncbi:hypothetical protein MKX07_000080 [Trichoderma sp. CBMAI-0711]|nr:hypothetical protein MKX07_000080 [Trichoderma sp. CBMAI-0711]